MSAVTVVTGTPGAGKTLHSIEKLIIPLVGTKIPQKLDDGTLVKHEVKIYTNIKGFLIDHELVEAGPAWECKGKEWAQLEGHRQGFHNWHEWARPGAVIVVDEFQKLWPPRPNGAPVPPDVQALDTVRHQGVTFILITQNVMNVDRHIHGLCTRHLHVRRVANLNAAIVYEWDHCSKGLLYAKSMSKRPWRFNKKVFKLYHSADLHVKGTRSLPSVFWFILVGLLGLTFLVPTVKARLSDRIGGGTKPPVVQVPAAQTGPVQALAASRPASAAMGGGQLPLVPSGAPAMPSDLAGCGKVRDRCLCFNAAGKVLDVGFQACHEHLPKGDKPLNLDGMPVEDYKPALLERAPNRH